MAFCTTCGSQKEEGLCPNCDQEQLNDQLPVQEEEETVTGNDRPKPEGSKKKKKRLAASLLILLLAGGGGYMAADNYYSAENTLDRLIEAIENEDADAIRTFTYGESAELSDAAFKHYAAMMLEGNRLSEFREDMAEYIKDPDVEIPDYPAVLESTGSQLGFFEDYALRFSVYNLRIRHDLQDDGVEVYYNDDFVGAFEDGDNRARIERIFPAGSAITLKYSGDYGDAKDTIQIEEIGDLYESREHTYTWDFSGYHLEISSNRNDSYLIINGEELNREIHGTIEYGPVNFNEIKTIQAYFDGRFDVQYSNELEVEPGVNSYELIFEEETIEEVPPEELYTSINRHVQEWVEAYEAHNSGHFSLLSDEFADQYLERTDDNFDEQQRQGWRYQGRIERIDYDVDSVEVLDVQGEFIEVSIDARLNFRSSFYEAGTNRSDTPLTRSVSEWTYYLVYDESRDTWLIDGQVELDGWNPVDEYRYEF